MEDPYFVVKQEVEQNLSQTQALYERWKELSAQARGGDELEWTANELRNGLRNIEWDLEDLDETIAIVEKNPAKFRLTPLEIEARKAFVRGTRQRIRDIRDQMAQAKAAQQSSMRSELLAPSARAAAAGAAGAAGAGATGGDARLGMDRYAKLDERVNAENDRFIADQHQQQQLVIEQQDRQLEQVSHVVTNLKQMGHAIGDELDEQRVYVPAAGHAACGTCCRRF